MPADQLSLAIRNKGQNAKLAAKLTGCKIDIKSNQEELEIPTPQPAPEPLPVQEEDDVLFEDEAPAVPESPEETPDTADAE